ncbi:hypothetical protein SLEP1_g53546 [Rubroshorea leprosula]|uniref:Uncharacterized protein n=1 Tax=Rubroshorea leprosula TaxID=152421 RepID=A0AAV5MBI5_9ROSI|nr:hypothetical protein SLEP1_g53546 [Rubroshorea leprosula]
MIVPPALQDLPETMTPESSASSSARENGGDHHTSSSSSSSSEETPSREEGMGDVVSNVSDRTVIGEWESKTITGRLSNLRKAPKDLSAGFRFKAALHHEVADSAPLINGLDTDVLGSLRRRLAISPARADIRPTGRLRAGPDAANAQQHKVHHRLYAVVCEVGGPGKGNSVQVAVPVPAVSQLQRREVVLPLREREEPTVQECQEQGGEWRVPNAHVNYPQLLPRDTDLKNQLLEYARRENLIDLDALVTSEQLAVFGFVDVANLFSEGEMSSILEHQRQQAQGSRGRGAGSTLQRQTRFDERPPAAPQSRSSSHRGSSSASRPRAEHRVEAAAPSARRRAREETDSEDEVPLMRRRTSGHAKLLPPVDRQRVRTFVQQHGGQVAMVKLMDAFNYAVALFESEQGARSQNTELNTNCKQLATEKASLMDDVNRLQGSEMANRAAAAESRAEELANRINELKEELERARAKRESRIQAAKEEAARVEEWAKKAEAERDRVQNELSSLRHQVGEADKNLSAAQGALDELRTSHGRSVSIARAQGVEWLVGSAVFQDAVAVASANVTTEIYKEIRGKVLHHRPDFPIRELAFFDGEDIDEQGKSLAPLVDTIVRLRWDLNEEGEPSSTPPNSQPAVMPSRSPVNAPTPKPAAQSSPTRSPPTTADASMPVDLTND